MPIDVVGIFSSAVCGECLKYGDLEKGKFQQGVQDFINKTRIGKEHFDRDGLVHDIYYAVLIVTEVSANTFLVSFKVANGREWNVYITVFKRPK